MWRWLKDSFITHTLETCLRQPHHKAKQFCTATVQNLPQTIPALVPVNVYGKWHNTAHQPLGSQTTHRCAKGSFKLAATSLGKHKNVSKTLHSTSQWRKIKALVINLGRMWVASVSKTSFSIQTICIKYSIRQSKWFHTLPKDWYQLSPLHSKNYKYKRTWQTKGVFKERDEGSCMYEGYQDKQKWQ